MKCGDCQGELNAKGVCTSCGMTRLEINKALQPPPIDMSELAARSAAAIQPEAEATCERLGLKTVEEKRAWLKVNFRNAYKSASPEEVESNREIARKVAPGGVND